MRREPQGGLQVMPWRDEPVAIATGRTRVRFSRVAVAMYPIVLLWSHALNAQEAKFLTIEAKGPLTPELRSALNDVVTPSSYESIIAQGAARAIPIRKFCEEGGVCSTIERTLSAPGGDEILSDLPEVVDSKSSKPFSGGKSLPTVRIPVGRALGGNDTFVFINADDPVFKAHSRSSNEKGILAVPVDQERFNEGLRENSIIQIEDPSAVQPSLIPTWFEEGENPALTTVQNDLNNFGETRRHFALAPGASPEAIERVIELARLSPSTSVEVTSNPINEFYIEEALQGITFEGGASEECSNQSNWPYDVKKVSEILSFNNRVLQRLGSNMIHRSKILVVDTGLGTKLAQSEAFKRFLYVNPSELLYADVYYRDASLAGESRICLDVDSDWGSDAFGFAPDDQAIRCQTHTPLERIAPIPKKAGNRLPEYSPDHGSFVATLAVGGPDLMDLFPNLDRHIGLSFARITRSPDSDHQSVKTEVADLRGALKFAVDHEIDVVNASLRISNANFRRDLARQLSGFRGIVVAAAGNQPEQLTSDSISFPAAETGDIRTGEHLIVVGAVQREPPSRWWSKSAFSADLVDIAAPGVNLVSFDENAERVCKSGTSAAAPLVSFAAGILRSVGVDSASEVRRRILATAQFDPALSSKVAAGRVLDLYSALDVFVDLIWRKGDVEPRRVILKRPDGDKTKPVLLQLCKPQSGGLERSDGIIDVAALVFWSGEGQSTNEIWHRLNSGISNDSCEGADTELAYYDLETRSVQSSPLNQLSRIVPSPFRSVIAETKIVSEQ
ncbi:S8 family serine peptidase [Sinorhizobium medicae]|nr:S8 family serine peptidase [Sinorhizobium medicae]MDX0974133.1 S8 family serine peptidase [Sinorhizobium medicae]MDX1146155.1 S8 family serine peptidase [Sinorhizobium medicae]PLU00101.1 hypothetical protein BMJ32_17590 [Sinorhizobium medicae]PLU51911.1 hypothetical protein BMJ23_25450 [Sinorhizobium medicae]